LVIEDGQPVDTAVGGLINTARGCTDITNLRIFRDANDCGEPVTLRPEVRRGHLDESEWP
jgi:hypothetical protein